MSRKQNYNKGGGGKQGGAREDFSVQDRIVQQARQTWLLPPNRPKAPFKPEVVEQIYKDELLRSSFAHRRVQALEFTQYLENYLWPNYRPDSPRSHVISMAAMVNEKSRERVPAWRAFTEEPAHFGDFIHEILRISLEEVKEGDVWMAEQIVVVIFLSHCFNSLPEEVLLTAQFKRVISLGIWAHLLPDRREAEFKNNDRYRKMYRVTVKHDALLTDPKQKALVEFERAYLSRFLDRFLGLVESVGSPDDDPLVSSLLLSYLGRCVLLFVDLESVLLTRRYFNTLLDDRHVVVQCRLAKLSNREEGHLFSELVGMLASYTKFEIDDVNGEALTDAETDRRHCERLLDLQRNLCVNHLENMKQLCLANVGAIENEAGLSKHLAELSPEELREVAVGQHLVPTERDLSRDFLTKVLIHRFVKRPSQLEHLNSLPLYPTEELIWDENRVPVERYSGEDCLALPKLGLQYLTLHDYLLRNFTLFRLESTYEIRQDIEDAVSRLKPWLSETGEVIFGGWSRMAVPLQNFSIVEVGRPHLGFSHPSRVRADITATLSMRPHIRAEWEGMRRYDPCFLITVKPQVPYGYRYNFKEAFLPQVGLVYVRGCEIEGLLDSEGKVITEEERATALSGLQGDLRTWRVKLDPCQYQIDNENMDAATKKAEKAKEGSPPEDIYDTFNILLRRRPKENNFKAVLETIRDLMNTRCVVPDWLQELLLGYEDQAAAHYSHLPKTYEPRQDWRDTFLNAQHLKDSFPQYEVEFVDKRRGKKEQESSDATQPPPYRLIFPPLDTDRSLLGAGGLATTADKPPILKAETYSPPPRPPLLGTRKNETSQPKGNMVRFTPTQTEAIRAGMQPGLVLVVGPPGTGKTDVAVQILNNIYHNYPNQRTLIVTHSNQALNQLFEKIMALNIDERHLLRLGHGETSLETEKDFSRYGRVNYVLARRLALLRDVGRLARTLGLTEVTEDDSMPYYTCETAQHFFLHVVLARWQEYISKMAPLQGKEGDYDPTPVRDLFPFTEFLAGGLSLEDAKKKLFPGESLSKDMELGRASFLHLEGIFSQLDEFRAFELMRTGLERANYLLVQEAKIIAMTCTHAALRRRDLVELGFTYDNILMEEAAQILEIETFIPLLLQNPDISGRNRLKRWVMIGDHHQLPPVVKNLAFQNYSNMGQSLFARLVKLGVPAVHLDAQGRARPSLARLYSWRYSRLDDLPHVARRPEFIRPNAGLAFNWQLIDVQDFQGTGESEPSPYFFQNLAEAEYVVAVFMLMRILGYPAHKISILTTYNGQKHLLRDVVKNRCESNPLIGTPDKITTVDKFQGQQNDYILLSLVRTRTVGHLRDVRRLVVAMSRARLGLYVFARVSLFESCHELSPAFNLLKRHPTQLHLAPWETWREPGRAAVGPRPLQRPARVVKDMTDMANFVFELYNIRLEGLMAEHRGREQRMAPPISLPQPPEKRARLEEGGNEVGTEAVVVKDDTATVVVEDEVVAVEGNAVAAVVEVDSEAVTMEVDSEAIVMTEGSEAIADEDDSEAVEVHSIDVQTDIIDDKQSSPSADT